MTSSALVDLFHGVLRGEATPEALFAAIESARATSPEAAAALLAEVEQLFGSNQVHYDLYLRIRDAVTLIQPQRHTVPPPMSRIPARETVLSAGSGPADRTMLRVATRPPPAGAPAVGTRPPPPAGTRPPPIAPPPAGTPPATGSWPNRATAPGGEAPDTMTWVTEQPLEPGSMINNRFVLEQRLGEGGMGVVFKARDLRKEEARDRDPYVAIKFLNAEFRRHPEALMALQRETRRAQTLAHPNIITVHDFDRDGTLIYMTMEYLDGEPLDRFIQRHPQGLRFKEAWPIIEGCARALAHAHEEGVVHADFKPGNVFVSAQRRVKVLDFGIARAVHRHGADPSQGTRFDAGTLGALTPAYASPEMLLGEQPDPRDDVYALACVTHELLTGRHPFKGATAVKAAHDGMQVKRVPGMSRRQHRALVHGLAFRQADRSPGVEAFLDEIAGPLGARGRALRQAILSTAVTAVVVAGLAFGAWWLTRADQDAEFMQLLMEEAQAQLQEDRERGKDVEPDLELRDVLLEQGNEYLAMSAAEFSAPLLSEGVSSAYGSFRAALRIDPANETAARGIVEVARRYEVEARRLLDAGDYAGAAEIAQYGLKVHPGRESLLKLRRDAEARRDAATD